MKKKERKNEDNKGSVENKKTETCAETKTSISSINIKRKSRDKQIKMQLKINIKLE